MKFTVTMKDPDTLDDAITEAVNDEVEAMGLSQLEAEAVAEIRHESASAIASKWFEYGEYLTVEIDTDKGTCVVKENT